MLIEFLFARHISTKNERNIFLMARLGNCDMYIFIWNRKGTIVSNGLLFLMISATFVNWIVPLTPLFIIKCNFFLSRVLLLLPLLLLWNKEEQLLRKIPWRIEINEMRIKILSTLNFDDYPYGNFGLKLAIFFIKNYKI